MDILSLLKNLDKDTLEKGLKEATAFLQTEEGKNAAQMLSQGKMPTGEDLPATLKDAASKIQSDPNAQKALGEYLKRNPSSR